MTNFSKTVEIGLRTVFSDLQKEIKKKTDNIFLGITYHKIKEVNKEHKCGKPTSLDNVNGFLFLFLKNKCLSSITRFDQIHTIFEYGFKKTRLSITKPLSVQLRIKMKEHRLDYNGPYLPQFFFCTNYIPF